MPRDQLLDIYIYITTGLQLYANSTRNKNENVQKIGEIMGHTCFTCAGGAGECLKLAISCRSRSFSICKRSISIFDMLDSSIVSANREKGIVS